MLGMGQHVPDGSPFFGRVFRFQHHDLRGAEPAREVLVSGSFARALVETRELHLWSIVGHCLSFLNEWWRRE